MNVYDVIGVERTVVGYNKIADADGEHLLAVEYKLASIGLDKLREIFEINPDDSDRARADMIYCFDINQSQAKLLQPYVINGTIDLEKYFFSLECHQAPGFEDYWENKK